MNDLRIWNYNNSAEVRTVMIDNEPWFVLKDVCAVLEIHNHKDIPNRLEPDEVGRFELPHPQSKDKTIEMVCINESGLYSVILRSDKPQAKPFRKWVTSEVLPSIRKHGLYATEELLNNPDFMIQALTALKEEREKRKLLETENAQQKQIIGELKPRADYTDRILSNKGLVTITQIAKDYGMSGRKMNKLLEDLHVQYKQSGQWLLYADYHDKGYTHSKTINITRKDGTPDVTMETKWTQKGRLFIYDLLKSKDILPTIEQEQTKKSA